MINARVDDDEHSQTPASFLCESISSSAVSNGQHEEKVYIIFTIHVLSTRNDCKSWMIVQMHAVIYELIKSNELHVESSERRL